MCNSVYHLSKYHPSVCFNFILPRWCINVKESVQKNTTSTLVCVSIPLFQDDVWMKEKADKAIHGHSVIDFRNIRTYVCRQIKTYKKSTNKHIIAVRKDSTIKIYYLIPNCHAVAVTSFPRRLLNKSLLLDFPTFCSLLFFMKSGELCSRSFHFRRSWRFFLSLYSAGTASPALPCIVFLECCCPPNAVLLVCLDSSCSGNFHFLPDVLLHCHLNSTPSRPFPS